MSLAVIVPTKDEQDNIRPFIDELLHNGNIPDGTTVIFADDSEDETPSKVKEMVDLVPQLNIVLLHREPGERHKKLIGAVSMGIDYAREAGIPMAVVMDVDLQHPPSLIRYMIERLNEGDGKDLVIASRYTLGGDAFGLDGPLRHAVSRGATMLSRLLFPRVLRGVTDPMTGFFLFRTDRINTSLLEAGGFKILFEILGHQPELSRTEVPLLFGERLHGESNAGDGNGKEFLKQLWSLNRSRMGRLRRRLLSRTRFRTAEA